MPTQTTPPTLAEICKRLRKLADEMIQLGTDMEFVGGFSALGEHGRELTGAACIARGWADGIEEEDKG